MHKEKRAFIARPASERGKAAIGGFLFNSNFSAA